MEYIAINGRGIKEAVAILKKGGVVTYPADTCFGLAADMHNEKAVKKIIAIKGRAKLKPMSVMFSQCSELDGYVEMNELNEAVICSLLPGPYTLVLRKGPKVPTFYFPETDSLGIRIPNHALSLELVERFGGPLITTSANRSGGELLYRSEEVENAFKKNNVLPDLIFKGEIADRNGASTVVQIKDGKAILIREGIVKKAELERRLGLQII